ANELIFGAGMTVGGFSAAGVNLTSRILTWPDADIAEDRLVTTTGSYAATAPLYGPAAWLMQVVGFKNTVTAPPPPPPPPTPPPRLHLHHPHHRHRGSMWPRTTMTFSGRGGIHRKPC